LIQNKNEFVAILLISVGWNFTHTTPERRIQIKFRRAFGKLRRTIDICLKASRQEQSFVKNYQVKYQPEWFYRGMIITEFDKILSGIYRINKTVAYTNNIRQKYHSVNFHNQHCIHRQIN
jgi:hypothetical protein